MALTVPLKDESVTIHIVETPYQFGEAIRSLERYPVLSCDTETVGEKSLEYWDKAAQLDEEIDLKHKHVELIRYLYEGPYRSFRNKKRKTETRPKLKATIDSLIKTREGREDWELKLINAAYRNYYYGSKGNPAKKVLDFYEKRLKATTSYQDYLLKEAQNNKSGLNFWENHLGCLQIADSDLTAYLIRPSAIDPIKLAHLLQTRTLVLGHHFQFDYKVLRHHLGVDLNTVSLYDTMIAEYLIGNGKFGEWNNLGAVALRRLDLELDKDKSLRVSNWLGDWTPKQIEYGALDVASLHLIKDKQIPILQQALPSNFGAPKNILDTFKLEAEVIQVAASMELNGLGVNLEKLEALRALKEHEVYEAEKALREFVGYECNLGSPTQLIEALRGLGMDINKTDKKALRPYKDQPVVQALENYRSATKIMSTYILPFQEKQVDGRIYAQFKACGPETGRFAGEDPNPQNLPPEFRELIEPSEGNVIVSADYSAIEPRLLAEFSGDKNLIRAFQEDLDPYLVVGELVFQIPYAELLAGKKDQYKTIRDGCKVILLGDMYGRTKFGMAQQLGVQVSTAEYYKTRFSIMFPKVNEYIQDTINFAKEHHFVRTVSGRIRYLEGMDTPAVIERLMAGTEKKAGVSESEAIKKAQFIFEESQRQAVNTVIQGSAAEINKKALIVLYHHLKGTPAKIIATIHDENAVETPIKLAHPTAHLLKDAMVSGFTHYIHTVRPKVEPVIVRNLLEAKGDEDTVDLSLVA